MTFIFHFKDPRDNLFEEERLLAEAEVEGVEENDDDEGEEEEDAISEADAEESPIKKGRKPRGSLLTGRGVTMQMLIEENILEAGERLLSIDYLVGIIHQSFGLRG